MSDPSRTIRESFEPNWLSARKLIEYYLDSAEPRIAEPEKELYEAVISGEVRARAKGVVYGPEWLKQLDKLVVDKDNPYALPPDVGLSLEDAKRKWSLCK